jgi:3-methyladenine DNA glycosylase AlkD
VNSYVKKVTTVFKLNADDTNANYMRAYMKNKADFLGIKTPLREELSKPFLQKDKIPSLNETIDVVSELWEYPYREIKYFALTVLEKKVKELGEPHLALCENLVQDESWWDTVDFISARIAGRILYRLNHLQGKYCKIWNNHTDIWMNRMGIIHQIKFKEKTNEDILFANCLTHAESKEFFIQKAIGWSLREYSKTNPEAVVQFVEANTFKPLSVREALRLLNK